MIKRGLLFLVNVENEYLYKYLKNVSSFKAETIDKNDDIIINENSI